MTTTGVFKEKEESQEKEGSTRYMFFKFAELQEEEKKTRRRRSIRFSILDSIDSSRLLFHGHSASPKEVVRVM